MSQTGDELVFAALGGLGEIGMNLALYGFGPARRRKWIMVDCGISFGGPELPGIELVMADISFIGQRRQDLLGIFITHAHEDHIGAIPFLWSRLGAPVYATRFAADLLGVRRLSEADAPQVPLHVVTAGQKIELAPFSVEYVRAAHSIPESASLAIRTPLGLVLHSGDWKLDPEPGIGWRTDEARLRAIGEEGVLALISDSTNIMRDGVSPSETEVGRSLAQLIAQAQGRVLVTTFASNAARLRLVAEAAQKAGRKVIIAGRAMDRVSTVARELGMLDGIDEFYSMDAYSDLPRNKVVVLATGSQGEGRAALARIAEDNHPAIRLAAGDQVIFSSRPIPGNERAINAIINGLVRQGVEVITDRTHLVHVSGHPRRSEVEQLYSWLRPAIAIPAHGEALHLAEHAKFARAQGVEHVLTPVNGDLVVLAPGAPAIIDQIPHGRLLQDGNLLVGADDNALRERKKLSFAGVVSVALAVTSKGDLAGDPDVQTAGLPARAAGGQSMDKIIDDAVFQTFESMPRARRRDPDTLINALERGVRSAVNNAWGKRPQVHVLVVEV
ncbi:MAG: ribonuclease J [Alphaproteobacteria bacterium]|nr:ribonuclease J [Alphaproteobacteria bacterium]